MENMFEFIEVKDCYYLSLTRSTLKSSNIKFIKVIFL